MEAKFNAETVTGQMITAMLPIFNLMLDEIDDCEELHEFLAADERKAVADIHHFAGCSIRNKWFWRDTPYRRMFEQFGLEPTDVDGMSWIALTSLHRRENGKPIDLAEQIRLHLIAKQGPKEKYANYSPLKIKTNSFCQTPVDAEYQVPKHCIAQTADINNGNDVKCGCCIDVGSIGLKEGLNMIERMREIMDVGQEPKKFLYEVLEDIRDMVDGISDSVTYDGDDCDEYDETTESLCSIIKSLRKRTKRAFKKSSSSIRQALNDIDYAVRLIEVEDGDYRIDLQVECIESMIKLTEFVLPFDPSLDDSLKRMKTIVATLK